MDSGKRALELVGLDAHMMLSSWGAEDRKMGGVVEVVWFWKTHMQGWQAKLAPLRGSVSSGAGDPEICRSWLSSLLGESWLPRTPQPPDQLDHRLHLLQSVASASVKSLSWP